MCIRMLILYLSLLSLCSALVRVERGTYSLQCLRRTIPYPRQVQELGEADIRRSSMKLDMSLISSEDQWSIYAAIASTATLGLTLERKTALGKLLSGPVTAMLLSSILTNVGILPSSGSIYINQLQSFVVKIATPILLLGADLKVIFRDTGNLLKAFIIGSFATITGSVVSYSIFHRALRQLDTFQNGNSLVYDNWKIISALTAKNIGGGLNFIAVTDIFQIPSQLVAAGLAVDNIVGLMYFPLISWLASRHQNRLGQSNSSDVDTSEMTSEIMEATVLDSSNKPIPVIEIYLGAIAISLIIVASSEVLARLFSIPSIILSTFLSVAVATIFHKRLQPFIQPGETIGKMFLYLFFSSVGLSSGKISSLFQAQGTGALLGFNLLMYLIHITVIVALGRVNNIAMPDILIASNANIGNAATASAFASSMGWNSKTLPALLVGTFGNIIATFVSVWLGSTVLSSISARL